MDAHTINLFILRWIHFIAGITWIGHLYFFNFVNGPMGKVLDAPTKKAVVPQLMPRALWWFRWGAMITFLSGLAYLYYKYWVIGTGWGGEGGLMSSTAGQWITWGALLGIIMWFNVWMIIWPNQKRIIRWIKAGETPADMPARVKKAALISRINTYLSVPMLFAMGASSHLPVINPLWILGSLVVGFGIVWCLYQMSAKTGANFA